MKQEQALIVERTFKAPVDAVWKAITDREMMKQWYFDMNGFKPEVGCEFSFVANAKKDSTSFTHLCRVTEVVPGRKISYTWRYDGYEGDSLLTMELFDEGKITRLKLTHAGLETFKHFARTDFEGGWNYFVNLALPDFLVPKATTNNYHTSISANVSEAAAFDCICRVSDWWGQNVEGSTRKWGDVFTIHFGDTFVTFKIINVQADKKIVWQVTDCYLPWLADKKEWQDTRIDWEISTANGLTQIDMTHVGLTPAVECYSQCEKGWDFHVGQSLLKLLTEGVGMPDTRKAERS